MGWMVLPDRIELSTSPLPMECSTTELRQHAPDTRIGPMDPYRAGRSLPQAPRLRKRERGLRDPQKRPKSARNRHGDLNWPVAGRFGSRFLPKVLRAEVCSIIAWGCFRDFLSRPRRDAIVAGQDLKVAAAAVIGLLLVRTPPGPTGSR